MTPGSGFKVARIFGIPIYLHSTWVVIFALSTFSLGNLFTQNYPHWTKAQQWGVGLLTSLLFFGSVLFHELAHSVVAQHYKIRVVSITLFIFGGLARIARDPSKAIQEFNIAVAGPLASFFLFGVFAVLEKSFPHIEMLGAIAGWLAFINFRLALFNLIPGFPLDGGRIFRAIVWGITKDYSRSTRTTARCGQIVAGAMIAAGAFEAVYGLEGQRDPIQGTSLAFFGWFIMNAAKQGRAQADARGALEGLRVADIMSA